MVLGLDNIAIAQQFVSILLVLQLLSVVVSRANPSAQACVFPAKAST
jgi:hypothetical protein